jgi:trehalose 6-phosphate synthase
MVQFEILKTSPSIGRAQSKGRLVVVSHRVPVPTAAGSPPPGGLAVALGAALETRGGLWFGWSGKVSGDNDPQLQERTVGNVDYAVTDLTRRDHDEYYHGFANSALWPVCHYRLDLADLSRRNANGYFRVNEQFARRLARLLRPDDTIWVHDYHFIPMAALLRDLGFSNPMGFFLHIPFPPSDLAAAMPNYDRILRSLASYDLVGFQTPLDAENFKGCIARANVGEALEGDWVKAHGRAFRARSYPISIETKAFAQEARLAERNIIVKRTRQSLEGHPLVIGVDRLDYSKGIKQRIDAFATFVEKSAAAAKARVTMLQITPKSRSEVAEYATMQRQVAEHVGHVNGKLGDVDWTPVRYINKAMSRAALAGLYRIARVGLVTPLRDGMNLVAKEYVAAQSPDDPGVLVLSRFAGAAYELDSALIVNPYDIEETAAAIAQAYEMPLHERKERWRAMMSTLETNDVDAWCRRFLLDLSPETEDIAVSDSEKPDVAAMSEEDAWRSAKSPLWTTVGR